MELKLTVLAGAKKGTAIPLKKDQFVIGRASECTLRAGSDAISRRHCVITRTADGLTVTDLGSRNGTFVNDEAIKESMPLAEGDQLRVGPLIFRVDPIHSKAPAAAEPVEAQQATAPQSAGLKTGKQPPVRDVADIAARLADKDGEERIEDDISRWLIGSEISSPGNSETVNLNVDETRAIRLNKLGKAAEGPAAEQDDAEEEKSVTDPEDGEADEAAESDDEKSSGSGWSIFGRGKKQPKSKETTPSRPKPGKLPRVPDKDKAKDSCEAAANVLREMTRRR